MNTKQLKALSIASIALSLFTVGFVVTRFVFAAITDTNFVHACVKNSNGSVRIIDPVASCAGGETAMTWNKDGVDDFGGFVTKDLSQVNFSSQNLSYRNFSGANLFDAALVGTFLSNGNFRNVNFTQANLSGATAVSTDFSNSNFTNASIASGAFFQNSDFTDAVMTGVSLSGSDFGAVNFTNVHFINADLSRANGFANSPVILTGVTWTNTICPDSTNSDNNGNTCEGHLVP